jgi:hypothetical protein
MWRPGKPRNVNDNYADMRAWEMAHVYFWLKTKIYAAIANAAL